MGVYMYQAALYCAECGEKLMRDLVSQGKLPGGILVGIDGERLTIDLDETTYDSDDFPKYCHEEGASDSPSHCASDAECENALDLTKYGDIPELHGAETRKIGAWLENDLTSEGEAALIEMVSEENPTPYQAALHAFWREVYDSVDFPSDEEDEEEV